ncbi:porin (plasmid) [Ensifer sp. PDNC004]|uniref:porin n=1 Tax=Ensifer sp. PDNC004 TaxID=2811423 RepID=UPI001965471D|nr:porin [Ensifer sp. PDNC004]QRY70844.1 porin [Ensifer sp. PDNC004]
MNKQTIATSPLFLKGAVAALCTMAVLQPAKAADAEPVEYVRVCDAYGNGFFYVPGTETCLKVSGYLRHEVAAGDDVYWGGSLDGLPGKARATMRFDARNETEFGTLRSYLETRFEHKASGERIYISEAVIELAGFSVGIADSLFANWTWGAGNVIYDDVIYYSGDRTMQASYTHDFGNGFSAMVGAEEGNGSWELETVDGSGVARREWFDLRADSVPHLLGGVKYEQDRMTLFGMAAYDTRYDAWAFKARVNLDVTDALSLFVMGAYQSDPSRPNYYGSWYGDWAMWGGASVKVSEKATINSQIDFEEDGTWNAALNVAYEVVPGFKITPELDYTAFRGFRGHEDAFGGVVRFQRNF